MTMRRLLVITLSAAAVAPTAALACADCDGASYAPSTAYIQYSGMTPEQQRQADAEALAADQDRAMEQARRAFVTRFAIQVEPSPEDRTVDAPGALTQVAEIAR